MTQTILQLDQITAGDESQSGGKAYNCARLKQAGFPVPDGIVVLTTATESDLPTLATHRWFDGLLPDTRFAVRSSGIGEDGGAQSFAGIHETRLNVRRADIGAAVKACWASAGSARALEYRRANRLATDAIQTGVLIQRMIQPVASGVAFTINPVTGADDELVINSAWGLGEELVSGLVDPDEFGIRKHDREPLWRRIGEKDGGDLASTPSLSSVQLGDLSSLLVAIEEHYGAPQDVEWCYDGAQFWVVQSRPVTAVRGGASETQWTRANLAEVLPDVTSPQALSAYEEMLNRAERQYMRHLMAPEDELGPMLKSFYGRLYFNLSQLRHVCAMGNIAPAVMLRSLGHSDAIQAADEAPLPVSRLRQASRLPDLLRLVFLHLRIGHVVRDHDRRTGEFLRRVSAVDPRTLPDHEIWSVIEEWFRAAPDRIQTVLLLGGVLFRETPVRAICGRVGFPFEQLVYPQLAAGERSVSSQQAFDLVMLANLARREPEAMSYLGEGPIGLPELRRALHGTAFLAEFERFLKTYGHRGLYESDWALPRYSEDPTPLLMALRAHIQDGSQPEASMTAERQASAAAAAWAAFEKRLTPWQRWTTLPRVRRAIDMIKRYYVWRERVRSDMVRILAQLRTWHLVLAERFVERGWLNRRDDYFLLLFREIAPAITDHAAARSFRTIAADRTAEMERYRRLQMPLLMRASELTGLIRKAGISGAASDDEQLTGDPVSGGCIEAEVVVVRDPGEFGRMKHGAILVARATDPSWTPLFTLASGVIVEVGGVLSHASTIAREYGLPALANVKDATKRLKTGERVRLDADAGIIYRTPEASSQQSGGARRAS